MNENSLKPTKNFRMKSATKYLLSTMVDVESRNAFKANMIQAQLASEQKPVSSKSKND